MPVAVTYPGVYIEEIPSSAHTVTPAPTSLAVFAGYTHPFKTKPENFRRAVRLFSFADYEREFGGFFSNSVFSKDAAKFASVAHAVYQFFLNGGSDCYVVALEPKLQKTGEAAAPIVRPAGSFALKTATKKIVFEGLEPTEDPDAVPGTLLRITVTFSNFQKTISDADTADVVITYGKRVETFRSVNLTGSGNADPFIKSNYIKDRINTNSQLVRITALDDTAFDIADTAARFVTLTPSPDPAGTIFDPADFNNIFKTDDDLDQVPIFNIMALPGVVHPGVLSAAIAFCERKMAFFIMDPDRASVPTNVDSYLKSAPQTVNGALYFPYLVSFDPSTGDQVEVPPSGTLAGIYARTDVTRGVWKAPAGLETRLLNTAGVVAKGRMNDPRHGVLNSAGVNCLRTFPNGGTVVFGARTLASANSAFQQFKYVPVRRMMLFIEQSLMNSLSWATFEPNDVPLWTALRLTVDSFMLGLFNNGALQGTKPSQAFRVICDQTTTTPDDVARGVVNIIVLFAPLRPAEFVVVKVGLLAGQTQA